MVWASIGAVWETLYIATWDDRLPLGRFLLLFFFLWWAFYFCPSGSFGELVPEKQWQISGGTLRCCSQGQQLQDFGPFFEGLDAPLFSSCDLLSCLTRLWPLTSEFHAYFEFAFITTWISASEDA